MTHVAAPPARGAAFFLQRRGERWLRTDVLVPSAPVDPQDFGHAVSLSGEWAAVAARTGRGGRVHDFRRGRGRWVEVLTVQRNEPEDLERFGNALSLAGSVLAVGDYGDDVLGTDTGAVYVYRFDGVAWTKEAELRSPSPQGLFGRAVATDGERILVAEFAETHVFHRDGDAWSLEATLVGHDVSLLHGDGYGESVALDGATAIVGAARHRHEDRTEGAAFVFRRGESGWREDAELLPDRTSIGASFGLLVAAAVERVLVSARGDDEYAPAAGAAYLFRHTDAGWTLEQKLFPIGAARPLSFASQVALDETGALVAHYPTYPLGAVYAYDLCLPANATSRNAATNPDVLRCEPPVLGGTLRASVDCARTGHARALVFGLDSPGTRVLGRLGVLLARDGGHGELLHAAPVAGPLAAWESPIPADARLLGLRCVVQAVLIGGAPSALTNAQDLVIGEY